MPGGFDLGPGLGAGWPEGAAGGRGGGMPWHAGGPDGGMPWAGGGGGAGFAGGGGGGGFLGWFSRCRRRHRCWHAGARSRLRPRWFRRRSVWRRLGQSQPGVRSQFAGWQWWGNGVGGGAWVSFDGFVLTAAGCWRGGLVAFAGALPGSHWGFSAGKQRSFGGRGGGGGGSRHRLRLRSRRRRRDRQLRLRRRRRLRLRPLLRRRRPNFRPL